MKVLGVFLIISFITITLKRAEGQKASSKRYRSKHKSISDFPSISNFSSSFLDSNANFTGSEHPSPIVYSSRAMAPQGEAGDYHNQDLDERESDLGLGLGMWNHRLGHHKDSYPLPSIAPRYNSGEKYGSGSGGNSNGNHGQQQQLYSSYPIGGGLGQSYYSNPLLEAQTYQYYEKERELKERAAKELLVSALAKKYSASAPPPPPPYHTVNTLMAAASSLLGSSAPPPHPLDAYTDALAAASGHGWGWGDDDHHKHKPGEYNNALALLGLMGLLSLLSSVLRLLTTTTTTTTPTTTTAAARRVRRAMHHKDVAVVEVTESDDDRFNRIFGQILPYLTPVAHAMNGMIPTECTLQGVCLTNKLLVKEFGLPGRPKGKEIATAVSALLNRAVPKEERKAHAKKISNAGLEGRNQRECEKIYPICSELKRGAHTIPFLIRMHEVPLLLRRLETMKSTSLQNLQL